VQHPYGGTRCGPRRRGRGRRLAEAAECRPWESAKREYGRLPPQDLRGRDRRHSHCLDLDVGTRLISVDLQEHVADEQGRALVIGHDDLDAFHGCHCRDMTIDVSSALSRATVEVLEIWPAGSPARPPAVRCKPAFDVDGHLLTTSERSTRSGARKAGPLAARLRDSSLSG
jgi:hypothetical protein